MEHFYKQPQFEEEWFTYPKLYSSFVEKLGAGSIIVEVGSWKGRSAAYMGVEIVNSKKEIKFYCVDTWAGSSYELFLSNIEPVKDFIIPVKKTSLEAALEFEDNSIDVVFIDADHSYLSVKNDIEAWAPKLKKGGVLSGHDYESPDVQKAVHEYMVGKNFHTQEACWVWEVV